MLITTPQAAGITLPAFRPLPADLPLVAFVRTERMVYVSGQIPDIDGLEPIRGQLGAGVDLELGREAARRAARNALAVLDHAAGGLSHVRGIVKVLGFVNSAPTFTEQPTVVNAASDLFVALWGHDRGAHARSAVGVSALPFGVPVEIEVIAELEED